jgi:hypothetical protein
MQFWNLLFLSSQTDRLRSRNRVLRLCSVLVLVGSLVSWPAPAHAIPPAPVLFVGTSQGVLRYGGISGELIDTFMTLPEPYHMPNKIIVRITNGDPPLPSFSLYILANQPGIDGGRVVRYDRNFTPFIDTFIDLTAQGFVNPTAMEFGPDGDLYVGGQHRHNASIATVVARFDGQTGALIDIVIPQLANDLDYIYDLAFDLGGNIYVGGTKTGGISQIQQYTGTNGAFLKVFVPNIRAQDLLFSDDDWLYVMDGEHISLYDKTGKFIYNFADTPGGTSFAFGMDLTIYNRLFVLSQSNNAIRLYNGTTGVFTGVDLPSEPNERISLASYPAGTLPPIQPNATRVWISLFLGSGAQ